MDPKDYLRQVVDHTINGNSEAAAQAFKQYLVPKTIQVLGIGKELENSVEKPEAEVTPAVTSEEPIEK